MIQISIQRTKIESRRQNAGAWTAWVGIGGGTGGAGIDDTTIAPDSTWSSEKITAALAEIGEGANGLSAYEIAVNNGFVGTEVEWLVSLQGADGADGKTAFESAQDGGYTGTEAQFNADLAKAGVWSKDTVAMACSDETSDLTASSSVPKIHYVFRDSFTRTLNSIVADLNTAPTGSTLTIDIKKNGTSIFSTLLTIDASETSNVTAATPYVLASAVTFVAGDYIDVYATVTGSIVAGKGLKINLLTTKS